MIPVWCPARACFVTFVHTYLAERVLVWVFGLLFARLVPPKAYPTCHCQNGWSFRQADVIGKSRKATVEFGRKTATLEPNKNGLCRPLSTCPGFAEK